MGILDREHAVFLDTEVFDSVRLDFANRNLEYLTELVASGQVHVLLSEIVLREIRKHIGSEAQIAADLCKKLISVPLFRTRHSDIVAKLATEAIRGELESAGTERLQHFLKASKAEVLKIDTTQVQQVFDDYFDSKPPFGGGKKKSEFPDAFSLHAVRAWAAGKKYPVHVISNDSDVKSFCGIDSVLQHKDSLVAFLAMFPDAEIARRVRDWMDDHWVDVQEFLANVVPEYDFSLERADGDVESVSVEDLDVSDFAVVEISDDTARLTAEVTLYINAHIYAFPPDWYPEDEREQYYGPSREHGSVRDTLGMTIDVSVHLESLTKMPTEVLEVEVVSRPYWPRLRVPDEWRGDRHFYDD